MEIKHHASGTSLAIQQLGLCPDTAGVTGSTPCWGTGTPRHTAQPEENKKIQRKLKNSVFQGYDVGTCVFFRWKFKVFSDKEYYNYKNLVCLKDFFTVTNL